MLTTSKSLSSDSMAALSRVEIGVAAHQEARVRRGASKTGWRRPGIPTDRQAWRALRFQVAALTQLDAHDEAAIVGRAEQGHAGGIRPAATERAQHAQDRLPDLGLLAPVLREKIQRCRTLAFRILGSILSVSWCKQARS